MNIKKIFKSLDFRNNKIINVKANLPTHEDHVIPRKYVDNETIYKTAKVLQYVNPFKLEWVTNPVNKTVLQLFDDIFFPLVNPTYLNPAFEYFRIEHVDKPGKEIIFTETNNTFKIFWKIIANDRLSNQSARIVITKLDNSVTTINSNSTSLTDEFQFVVDFTNVAKIEFVRTFNATTVTKNDSYGNPFVPADFQILYDLKFDILSLLKTKSTIVPSMLFCKVQSNENYETLINQIITFNNRQTLISSMSFVKSNNYVNLNSGGNNFIIFMIPKIITDTSVLKLNYDIVPYSALGIDGFHTLEGIGYNIYAIDFGFQVSNNVANISFQ